MALTPSTMLPLGTKAPEFTLADPQGNKYSLQDFNNFDNLLVVFMCNHCPFVKHIINDFAVIADEYIRKGVGIVGINSNDTETYPDDKPEKMVEFAEERGIHFPYLVDETQQAAIQYKAACTPDFFLFDKDRKLVYRGQLDDSRPGNDKPVTGRDLKAAMEAVLHGTAVSAEQKPSMGCGIKWKAGNEPAYF